MDKSKRQTGRTTAMLKEVIDRYQKTAEGDILIIILEKNWVAWMRMMLERIINERGIDAHSVEQSYRINFLALSTKLEYLNQMHELNKMYEDRLFVDHAVLETVFMEEWELMTKYDQVNNNKDLPSPPPRVVQLETGM